MRLRFSRAEQGCQQKAIPIFPRRAIGFRSSAGNVGRESWRDVRPSESSRITREGSAFTFEEIQTAQGKKVDEDNVQI